MRTIIALPFLFAATVAGAAPLPTYRVIQLSNDPINYGGDVNAKGQVAFTEYNGGTTRARFYDGRTVRDLGTLGGPTASVSALNDLGQVTGAADVAPDRSIFHAYRWTPATGMVDLTPTMRASSGGADINNRGQIAGTVNGGGQGVQSHGFFWSQQTGLLDIGRLQDYSRVSAMNDYGAIVGYGGRDSPYGVRAFRWTRAEGIRDIGTLEDEFTLAADINNLGHIVGATPFSNVPFPSYVHAFFWTPQGGLRNLGAGTGNRSTAAKINDSDMVIGAVLDFPVMYHGFIWTRASGMLEIGANRPDLESFAGDLNNQGQVVGGYAQRAFVWTRASGFVDLNTRLAGAPAGLVLYGGQAISENGAILADSNTGLVLLLPTSASQQAPVIGRAGMTGSARANAMLSFSASFTDVDPGDTHKASWNWGDGATDTAVLSEKNGAGSVSGQHVFRKPGIYTVKLSVTDSSGRSTTVPRRVIVSGPGAWVSGEASFLSPQGASRFAPRKAGTAQFAILAPAAKASGVQQDARVEFSAPGLGLHSEQVDVQFIRGSELQVRGSASVNGASGYRFLLTRSGDGKDRVRIRVWHRQAGSQAEVVDYDNLVVAQASANGSAGSALTDGGVAIPAG